MGVDGGLPTDDSPDPVPIPELEAETPNALGQVPNALGVFPDDISPALGVALGPFAALLTAEKEEVKDEQFKLKSEWRLEPRNDRKPPGYAIYERRIDPQTKKPVYIGYVGYNSDPSKKPPGFPTWKQITGG